MAHHIIATSIARANGIYARSVYLPVAELGRTLRTISRRWRGVLAAREHATRLPKVDWSDVFVPRPVYLTQIEKHSGNVTVPELAVLATAAANAAADGEIVEIGTFDGRTTLNLALNAPARTRVLTLDLPADQPTRFALAPGERAYVEKTQPGERWRNVPPPWSQAAGRITQLLGDSAAYDWSPHLGRAALVFVDGSHAYDYARADTETALRLLGNRGVAIWHDYGVWEGVTRALEEAEAQRHLGLRHIRGTSLVVFKARHN